MTVFSYNSLTIVKLDQVHMSYVHLVMWHGMADNIMTKLIGMMEQAKNDNNICQVS